MFDFQFRDCDTNFFCHSLRTSQVRRRKKNDQTLQREPASARRAKSPLFLLMIDIDHFKLLNDARGHQVGNACLRRIAGALRVTLPRTSDFVARYGGEEFAISVAASNVIAVEWNRIEAANSHHRSLSDRTHAIEQLLSPESAARPTLLSSHDLPRSIPPELIPGAAALSVPFSKQYIALTVEIELAAINELPVTHPHGILVTN
jgi:diguanylate cyclase (GGDEF)-like protein